MCAEGVDDFFAVALWEIDFDTTAKALSGIHDNREMIFVVHKPKRTIFCEIIFFSSLGEAGTVEAVFNFSSGANGINDEREDRDDDERDKAPPSHPNAKGDKSKSYKN